MLRSLKFRAILILALLFIAIIFLLPNFVELTGDWKESSRPRRFTSASTCREACVFSINSTRPRCWTT